MEKIAIMVDSGSNILEDKENGIFMVPLYLHTNDFSKKDIYEINRDELFEIIDKKSPTTSAPSIDDFSKKIEEIKKLGYEKIISISISSKLSGTFNAARIAFENSDIDYRIIDSLNGSYCTGFLAIHARKLANKGKKIDEIVESLERLKANNFFLITVSNLKYLIKSGRVPKISGFIGNFLNIRPIITIDDNGFAIPIEKCRGAKKTCEKIAELIREKLKNVKEYYLCFAYGEDTKDLEYLESILKDEISAAKIYTTVPLTSVLCTLSGPGALVCCVTPIV